MSSSRRRLRWSCVLAVVLGAAGLAVVGFIVFFMVAMNNWANNK